MSSEPKADGGTEHSFSPDVVTSEAEVAESLRMPGARDAEKAMEILEKTESVAIKLQSSWWGNEAFGVWSEWFFVKPDAVSSGGALFVDEGVSMGDAIGYFRAAENIAEKRREGTTGYTSEAQRRFKRKAFHWQDDSKKPGPGMPPKDDRESFTGGSVPLSVIDVAFRLPEPEDDLVFPAVGEPTTGKLSDGDVRVTGFKRTKYGEKAVLKGDTYDALSSQGDHVADEVWDDSRAAYDGDVWTCDPEGDALLALIRALNDAGYSVAVDESFKGRLNDAMDVAASFGVEL